MKIKGYFGTSVVGSEQEFEIEIDDEDISDEEIECLVWEYICDKIDYYWKKVEE